MRLYNLRGFFMRTTLVAVCLCSSVLAGCVGSGRAQDAGGIEAALPVVNAFSLALNAASESQALGAASFRRDQRELLLLTLLASSPQLETAKFEEVLCAGYEDVDQMRGRARQMRAAEVGLTELMAESPNTIVGLIGSLSSTNTLPVIQEQPAKSNMDSQCRTDAPFAAYAYPEPSSTRSPIVTSVLGAVDAFTSIIKPIVLQGLRQVDRAQRLRALRQWASDTQHGLPILRRSLDAAAGAAAKKAITERRLAAGRVYIAWDGLAQARATGEASICRGNEGWLDTLCVERVSGMFESEMRAVLTAAEDYDRTFDADPGRALEDSVRAADYLKAWLDGKLTGADALAAQEAALAAIYEWLQVLSDIEQLSEDEEDKGRLRAAMDGLREAFGGDD
jgi:hypothetical protein